MSNAETRLAIAKWKLRGIDAAALLQLQEDGAGNLYWRGRRLTAADYGKVALAIMLIGAACDLVRTGLDVGRAEGWW